MKVKVLKLFRDKNDHVTLYEPGMILEVKDEARANDLIERGLVKKFGGNQKAAAVLETADDTGNAAEDNNDSETTGDE